MPSLINNPFEEFFTQPNGNKVQFFETKSLDSRKIYIHHPLIHFDTFPKGDWEAGIYRQKFQLFCNMCDLSFIEKFIERFTFHAKIQIVDFMWHYTGFWTVKGHKKTFFGVGLNALKEIVKKLKYGELYFCLTSSYLMVIISSTFEGAAVFRDIKIDVYITNAHLSYVAIIQPCQNAINDMGKNTILLKGDVSEPMIYWYVEERKEMTLKPVALINIRTGPLFAVIENPFDLRNKKKFCPIEHLIAYRPGAFLEGDFNIKRRFYLKIENWLLDDVILLNFTVNEMPPITNITTLFR